MSGCEGSCLGGETEGMLGAKISVLSKEYVYVCSCLGAITSRPKLPYKHASACAHPFR